MTVDRWIVKLINYHNKIIQTKPVKDVYCVSYIEWLHIYSLYSSTAAYLNLTGVIWKYTELYGSGESKGISL